jgi:2-amino-4-hydroxy-6-hydroxymethyldihydropteridine diphosphokinase
MSVSVLIALGGNLGDVRSTGEAALALLNDTPGLSVERSSCWYSTAPIGCEGRFLNAAARLHSELTPTQLLLRLQEIETALGRVRTGHWTPRTLDLDIVLFGRWQIDHPQLKLPHPAAWCRRFVLDPACEVAGDLVHAGSGLTLDELRVRLLRRPLLVAWSGELRGESVTQGAVHARFGSQVRWAGLNEPGIVRFVPRMSTPLDPFEVALPGDRDDARRIVLETLTSLLDEPVPQS